MLHAERNQEWMFDQAGYFVLRNALQPHEVADLKSWITELDVGRRAELAPGEVPKAKIYDLYRRNPDAMRTLITNSSLVASLTRLLGPNVVFVTNRHNQASVNTSQMTSTEARLHRDILQHTRGLVTAAVYLDRSTVENGATRIVPGSHRLANVGVTQPDGGGTWMDEHDVYAGLHDQAVPVPLEAGDILLFNAMCFHSVGRNTTDESRTSIILGFRSADELDATPDDSRQVPVAGQHTYRGNDR